MITKGGEACVGNFGIAGIITDSNSEGLESMTTSKPSVVRYMAPELLDPVKASFTRSNPPKESDIFSLGMTAYQVFFPHFFACVTSERLLVTTRSSRIACLTVYVEILL
jgi:serine/threonine protein kinase